MTLANAMVRIAILICGSLLLGTNVFAVGTCSFSSPTLSAQTYTNAGLNVTATVNWTCSRTSNAADGLITLMMTAAGGTVTRSGNVLAYTLTPSAPSVPVTFSPGSFNGPLTGTYDFTLSFAASQNPIAGDHTGTLIVGGTCTTSKATACNVTSGQQLNFTVQVLSTCTMTAPATVVFSYISFQAGAALANSSYIATCTSGLAYRMYITAPASGTLLGLPYALMLGTVANSATDISSTSVYNRTGAGSAQTYFVNGTIGNGFSGTCGSATCSATSALHTLNLEF